MNPQYPGYIPPNQQQQFYGQLPLQNFVQQPPGYVQQPQQQCFTPQQQQCYVQQPQQCYMQQPMQNCMQLQQPCNPLQYQQNYALQQPQCYAQPQQNIYIQSQQGYCMQQQQQQQQQQQCCMQPQPQQCYNQSQQNEETKQPPQNNTNQQAQSRQVDEPQKITAETNLSNSTTQPVAYVAQSWNTSPVQQITGKPCGDVRPQFYYVFTPDMFTDSINPWTAKMWLQSFDTIKPETKITKPEKTNIETPDTEISKPLPKPKPEPEQQQQQQKKTKPKPIENPKPQIQKPIKNNMQIPLKSTTEIFKFESIAQFQKLRHHATVESALQQLKELATDLSFINPNSFNPDSASCFICCNSYVTERYKLGVGPINDAITVAANHKYMGYKVYFVHNQHQNLFLEFLKVFLQKVTNYLTIFFAGHGAQVTDTSGDEADGYDEVMVFDSGYIVDDELAIYLQKYSIGSAHTILLSDCCHSGTIWDIPEDLKKAKKFPANIMSVSSSNDNQTSKQTEFSSNLQGVFTFNLWTMVRNRPTITALEARKILNREMVRFNQEFVIFPTRKDMLTKPLFPLMAKHHNA